MARSAKGWTWTNLALLLLTAWECGCSRPAPAADPTRRSAAVVTGLPEFFPDLRTVADKDDSVVLCYGLVSKPPALILRYNRRSNTLSLAGESDLPSGAKAERGLRNWEGVDRNNIFRTSSGTSFEYRGQTYWNVESVFPYVMSVVMVRYGDLAIVWSAPHAPIEVPEEFSYFALTRVRARWRYEEGTEMGVDIYRYDDKGKLERLASYLLPWEDTLYSTIGTADGMAGASYLHRVKGQNIITWTRGDKSVYVFAW